MREANASTKRIQAGRKTSSLSEMEQFQLELEMENREYIEKQIERISVEVRKHVSSKAVVRRDGIYDVVARIWRDHSDDGAGGDW